MNSPSYLLVGCIESAFPMNGNTNGPDSFHDSQYNSRRLQRMYEVKIVKIARRKNILAFLDAQ